YENVYRNKFVDGSRLRQKFWDNLIRYRGIERYILAIGSVIDSFGGKRIPHTWHVGCDRAVSKRDQRLSALTYHLDLVKIFFAADGPFHQGYIHVFGENLGIDQWTIDQLRAFGERQQAFVDVEKRHVAARATIQPHRCHAFLGHFCSPLISWR